MLSSRPGIVTSATVKTAAGDDVFRLLGLIATESIGQPFVITIDLTADNDDIKADTLLGTAATVSVALPGGGTRNFSGLVNAVAQPAEAGDANVYRLELVPWISVLQLGSDCRIFQNKTPPDIVKEVFDDLGFTDYDVSGLVGSYPELPFCVQFNETHFDFVHRLLQRWGISYHSEQSDGSHQLVFTDDPSSRKPFSGYEKIPFNTAAEAAHVTEHIDGWTWQQRLASGKQVLKDYDYTNPSSSLEASSSASPAHSYTHGDLELFHYPGHYTQQSDGDTLAKIGIEAATCREQCIEGTARCWGLAAGHTFTLEDFPRKDQNQSYLLTSVRYTIAADGDGERHRHRHGYTCQAAFTAVPAAVNYRPERTTPWPLIAGVQTAVVVGPAGHDPKTPYTDTYGNIRVQFRWDRQGQSNEKSSCWLRYKQFSAGTGTGGSAWGAVFLPRIGCEVAIAFEQGDPDRPLAIGGLYNAANMPPQNLAADQKTSTLKDDGGNFLTLNPDESTKLITLECPEEKSRLLLGNAPPDA